MNTADSILALVVATTVLVLIPGPNVALIVANSLRSGLRMGIATVLGTSAGVALQLLLVIFGLTAVVSMAAEALTWIKWAGVAYLLYLGIRSWREPAGELHTGKAAPAMFRQGCMIAMFNPKTLLFNAAFIPQFVSDGSLAQFAGVGTVFLAVLVVGDILWAVFASSARGFVARYSTLRNRVTGAFLVAAGIGLALARR